jgi:hypothetical protein
MLFWLSLFFIFGAVFYGIMFIYFYIKGIPLGYEDENGFHYEEE